MSQSSVEITFVENYIVIIKCCHYNLAFLSFHMYFQYQIQIFSDTVNLPFVLGTKYLRFTINHGFATIKVYVLQPSTYECIHTTSSTLFTFIRTAKYCAFNYLV